MSAIRQAVYDRLKGFGALTALVGGASSRIFAGHAPQDTITKGAYVTIHLVDRVPEHLMGADAGVEHTRIQISTWARTLNEARNIAVQVHAALSRWSGTQGTVTIQDSLFQNENDFYHGEAQLHQINTDFVAHHVG